MKTKTFIVPHDFTPVADIALEHAIATAKPLGAQIYVLHVVPKEKDINEAEGKLSAVLAAHKDSGAQLIPYVRLGSIFEEIGDFAAEHHAELIFMGTHGAHGWQHITGSHALKVVTSSSVPFIIVQEKGIKEKYGVNLELVNHGERIEYLEDGQQRVSSYNMGYLVDSKLIDSNESELTEALDYGLQDDGSIKFYCSKDILYVFIIVEYDGAPFVGWQRQDNGITVQQKLEEAAFAFTGEHILVQGAGRTDSGVHALGQVAHLDVPEKFAPVPV